MNKKITEIVSGIVVDETTIFTLQEVCYSCNVQTEIIEEMMAHGLVEPKRKTTTDLHFDAQAVRRLKIALRLQNDLGVNLAGAALALDLLNELQNLRNQVVILQHQITLK